MSHLLTLALVFLLFVALAPLHAEEGAEDEDPLALVERLLERPPATGLLVRFVAESSAAAAAAVRVGDTLVSYDGLPATTIQTVAEAKAKASAAGKESVTVVLAGPTGTRREVTVATGSLGVGLIPVEAGKPASALPPATEKDLPAAAFPPPPRDDWYAFLHGQDQWGFEHGLVKLDGDALVVRREVAFDGGAEWGLNHFDVTIRVSREHPLDVRSLVFDTPRTAWTARGEMRRGPEGGRTWHVAAHGPDGADAEEHDTRVPDALPLIPTYYVEVLASAMPRRKGACLHFRPLVDMNGTLMLREALYVVGPEEVLVGGKPVAAWRVEDRRLGGELGSTFWVAEDGQVVRADYGGPVASLTTKAKAIEHLHPDLRPRSAD